MNGGDRGFAAPVPAVAVHKIFAIFSGLCDNLRVKSQEASVEKQPQKLPFLSSLRNSSSMRFNILMKKGNPTCQKEQ